MITEITDINDKRVSLYTSLTDSKLRKISEYENGIFIAESPTVIEVAIKEGYTPISFFTEIKYLNEREGEIIKAYPDIPAFVADKKVMEKITGFALTRGMLAAMERKPLRSAEEICKSARRIAVLEDIADSTNTGAIIRSAAALGIDAVLITPACCDPLCRRSVRVSMGTVFQIPWAYIGKDYDDWNENGIALLHSLGFKTVAMALTDNSVSIDDKALKNEDRLAIILGSEGYGLSEKTISDSDYTVKIPMYHNVDSLNVAAASAVAFWELK